MAALTSTDADIIKAGALEKRAGSSAKTQTSRLFSASISTITGTKKRWVSLSTSGLSFHEGADSASAVKHSFGLASLALRMDPSDESTLVFTVGGSSAPSSAADPEASASPSSAEGSGGGGSGDGLSYQVEYTAPEGSAEATAWVNAVVQAGAKARGLIGGAASSSSSSSSSAEAEHARHRLVLGTAHSAALLGDHATLHSLLKDAAKHRKAREEQLAAARSRLAAAGSSSSPRSPRGSSPPPTPRRMPSGVLADSDGGDVFGEAAAAVANGADKAGLTPAQWAAMAGQERCLELLLEAGAAIKPFSSKGSDNAGDSLLHSCCRGLPPLPLPFYAGVPGGSGSGSGSEQGDVIGAVGCARLVLKHAAGGASGGRTRKEADLAGSINLLGETPLGIAIMRGIKARESKTTTTTTTATTATVTTAVSGAASLVACLCLAGADASDALASFLYTTTLPTSDASNKKKGATILPPELVVSLLRHGAKPNLSAQTTTAEATSGDSAVDKSSSSSSPAGRVVARLAAASSSSGVCIKGAEELEVLVCLAKAGGRVSSKELASLTDPAQRATVVEAIAAWEKDMPTERFGIRGTVVVPKEGWVPDKDSSTCLSCKTAKFTTTNRRHHCRFCAELVCGPCSVKMLRLTGESKPQRSCDRCFNRESKPEVASAGGAATGAATGAGGGSSSPPKEGDAAANALSVSGAAAASMADTKRQMQDNLETAKRANEKAGDVKDKAAEYRDMTRQLKDQAKAQSCSSLW